jgi:hypothetical protein
MERGTKMTLPSVARREVLRRRRVPVLELPAITMYPSDDEDEDESGPGCIMEEMIRYRR